MRTARPVDIQTMWNLRSAALALVAIMLAMAPAAHADSTAATAERIASNAGISLGTAQAAVHAADRVRREMHREGARDASIRGCWRRQRGTGCTGVVAGNDGFVKWRCVLEIRIRPSGRGPRAKLTDAVCTAEAA
jgi:hypothetical protein